MNNTQPNSMGGSILVVDDNPDNLRVLSASLTERGYQVRCVKNGAMALITAQKLPPNLILLDISMPGMDGYEVCQQLKSDDRTRDIPVIFLSALDDALDKVKAFQVGGTDYITKPFQIEEIIVRIQHQLALQVARAEIEQLNSQLEQKVKQRTAELEEVVRQLNQEVAQHQKTQKALLEQALQDALTGLPNRTLLMEHLQKALYRYQRNKSYLFAVLFIDLDRFKVINDSLGHAVGDRLLVAVSHILKGCTRETDTVARLSGDEFAILLEDIQDRQTALAIAERLLEQLTAPVYLDDRKIFTGASIGIVFGAANYQNGTELLRDADIAMYRSKALGRGRYAIFDREMYAQTLYLSQIETDLRHAIERQEFLLHYQPIVSLSTDKVTGFEALLRWQHPEKGLVYPGDFITIAEDTGLIVTIGEWVLQEACQQLWNWQQTIPSAASVHVSVNLSSRQIKQLNFVDKLTQILNDTGLNGSSLRLELTESMLMDKGERTIELLSKIKAQNIQLSIDDFGTGYSSLSYLHRFPIDALKIDRSFINLIDPNGENCEIVNTIIILAHSLGIKAIAEGVETAEQLDRLKKLGCDEAQGYFFSKPVSHERAEALLNQLSN
ncbi:GGDEF domain-containing response regulator [Pseudanabaena sp. PCC 6802]|uniref:two-component system response regulator n=1 Tax=Pseudanabaena sp. PCC 6802 TaxID=118173 RepID=UPI00034B3D63|nr:GGDEF domain-containing response regulator [Pseudanabaena sp. PCC 6802]